MINPEEGFKRAATGYDIEPEQPLSEEGGSFTFARKSNAQLRLVKEQYKNESFIFDSAIEVGVEFFEATGGEQILPEHFENLRKENFIEFGPDDVDRVFDGDWKQLESDIAQAYEAHRTERIKIKQQILQELKQERHQGKLPPQLFLKFEERISANLPVKRKNKNGITYAADVGVITGEEVDEDEMVARFSRFRIVKDLIHELFPEGVIGIDNYSIQRAILSANFKGPEETHGKLINHGFIAELRDTIDNNCKNHITESNIAQFARLRGWEEFVFQDERKKRIESLVHKSGYVPTGEKPEAAEPAPKQYFDLRTGTVIDEQFLEAFKISADEDEHDIRELGELLRDYDTPISANTYLPHSFIYEYVKKKKGTGLHRVRHKIPEEFSKERLKRYGQWLAAIVAPPSRPGEKLLNQSVLNRAYRLGLGPGSQWITDKYDKLSNFYLEIDVSETQKVGIFDNWTLHDFISYIKEVGGDSRPTAQEFNRIHKNDPTKPHRDLMHDRFLHIGGFNGLLTLAGYPVITLWNKADYIDWGVKFVRVNGYLPTARALDFLSVRKQGPSSVGVADKFERKLGNFHSAVLEAFEQKEEGQKVVVAQRLSEIESEIYACELPKDMFSTAETEREKISIYAKYRTVDAIFPDWPSSTKAIISTSGINGSDFYESIKLLEPNISSAEIEQTAAELGFLEEVAVVENYAQSLKLGDDYETFRKNLNQKKRVWHKKKIKKLKANGEYKVYAEELNERKKQNYNKKMAINDSNA